MGMMQEFKEFAMKGNVMDLAVGVIIGGAFGKIVDSVVADLIMPIVAFIMGGKLDFSGMFVVLGNVPPGTAMTLDALKKAQVPVFAYGNFITIVVNFVILAFIIFMMIKQMNRLRKAEPAAPPPATPEDIVLLREIRDSLKK
ncbi:large conductance mechanosensitive channel protein MscL [Propionivibrio sp.]|uniref:large conductance mechanosensitive channel protein MscL n=1 Tax=Propionivibrio sp. TaxID=2212460 RepID=UPI0039E462BD